VSGNSLDDAESVGTPGGDVSLMAFFSPLLIVA
jgi:hypothetical protein